MNKEIHEIQINILRVLLFKPEACFTDLNPQNVSTDHFNFHVKRLLELGLIQKNESGLYSLTTTGKEFANRLDTDSKKIVVERQAKIGVLIGCVRGDHYLIQQRLKQPFYGYHGFVTGKVKWGETVLETAARELEEETGLSAEIELVGVEHKMDYDQDNNLLEDKYFYVCRATNPKGNLIESFEGGKNLWVAEKDLTTLPDVFDDMSDVIKIINSKTMTFQELKFKVKRY
jgi:ADP-ribose pyrophosphatase YjhB (NUDIX family)/predicted transcriptional regulator